ncbi:MAG: S8 family serine peptidase [Candidatus Cybelea sp.]
MKLFAPLFAVLAVAACTAGGSSDLPGAVGAMPEWQAKHLARPACPFVVGVPVCMALIESEHVNGAAVAGWGPQDLRARYRLPFSSTNGAGQIVALVDAYDNPNVASDLAAYRAQFGLGTAKFYKYNQQGERGNYPAAQYGWGLEIDLDVEMVSAVCPACTIDLVEAKSMSIQDLEAAEAQAASLGAHIVSNSWDCVGWDYCANEKYFAAPGVLYLAASGDYGYNVLGAPAVFPNVVAVGGTVLVKKGSEYRERAWKDSGAGCTSVKKPKWQKDPDCKFRTVADISAVAWNVAAYDTFGYGGWLTTAGTSLSTPITAGIFALAGNASALTAAAGFWSARQSLRRANLNTIRNGSDGSCGGEYLCTAGTNQYETYSGPAGWGTPYGIGLY